MGEQGVAGVMGIGRAGPVVAHRAGVDDQAVAPAAHQRHVRVAAEDQRGAHALQVPGEDLLGHRPLRVRVRRAGRAVDADEGVARHPVDDQHVLRAVPADGERQVGRQPGEIVGPVLADLRAGPGRMAGAVRGQERRPGAGGGPRRHVALGVAGDRPVVEIVVPRAIDFTSAKSGRTALTHH